MKAVWFGFCFYLYCFLGEKFLAAVSCMVVSSQSLKIFLKCLKSTLSDTNIQILLKYKIYAYTLMNILFF